MTDSRKSLDAATGKPPADSHEPGYIFNLREREIEILVEARARAEVPEVVRGEELG